MTKTDTQFASKYKPLMYRLKIERPWIAALAICAIWFFMKLTMYLLADPAVFLGRITTFLSDFTLNFVILLFVFYILSKGYKRVEKMLDPFDRSQNSTLEALYEEKKQIEKIFINSEEFEKFRSHAIKILFNRKELLLGFFIAISFTLYGVYMLYSSGLLFVLYEDPAYAYLQPYGIIEYLGSTSIYFFVYILLGTVLWFIISIIRITRNFASSKAKFDIFVYTKNLDSVLKGSKWIEEPKSVMDTATFELFQNRTTIFGRTLFILSMLAMIFSFVYLVSNTIQRFVILGWTNIGYIPLIIAMNFVILVCLFIAPQWIIHNALTEAKSHYLDIYVRISDFLNKIFLDLSLNTNAQLNAPSLSPEEKTKLNKQFEEKEGVRKDIEKVDFFLEKVKKFKVWSFDIQVLGKLIATFLLPLIILVIQSFIGAV